MPGTGSAQKLACAQRPLASARDLLQLAAYNVHKLCGMPAGEDEGDIMSVMALVGGRPIRASLAHPSKA